MGGLSEGSDREGVVCSNCGAEARAAAVFCRSCGTRLEPRPQQAPPVSGPSPEAPQGRSYPEPPARPPVAPPPPAPRPPGARRGVTALLVVGACVVLGALVGGGAYLLTSGDSSAGDAPNPPRPIEIEAGGGTSTTTVTVPDETDDDEGDDGGGGSGSEGGAGGSDLAPGRYIQAGSFRLAENAEQEVGRLQEAGIDAFTVPSAEGDELLPGFQVLLVGPLSGAAEERRVLADLRGARVSGIRKDLTPSPSISGPEDVAGSWSGQFEQSSVESPRLDGEFAVRFSIDSDGSGGSVEYDGCRGRLSLAEQGDLELSYEESIRSGRCASGGVWHLRPEGEELIAVRLYDDSDVILHGTADRG